VERRHAVALCRVDVRRLLQQHADGVTVALHRRVGHRRRRRGVQERRERKGAEAEHRKSSQHRIHPHHT